MPSCHYSHRRKSCGDHSIHRVVGCSIVGGTGFGQTCWPHLTLNRVESETSHCRRERRRLVVCQSVPGAGALPRSDGRPSRRIPTDLLRGNCAALSPPVTSVPAVVHGSDAFTRHGFVGRASSRACGHPYSCRTGGIGPPEARREKVKCAMSCRLSASSQPVIAAAVSSAKR